MAICTEDVWGTSEYSDPNKALEIIATPAPASHRGTRGARRL
jgi:hypothetical protein